MDSKAITINTYKLMVLSYNAATAVLGHTDRGNAATEASAHHQQEMQVKCISQRQNDWDGWNEGLNSNPLATSQFVETVLH